MLYWNNILFYVFMVSLFSHLHNFIAIIIVPVKEAVTPKKTRSSYFRTHLLVFTATKRVPICSTSRDQYFHLK